jgi:hypothetical protein
VPTLEKLSFEGHRRIAGIRHSKARRRGMREHASGETTRDEKKDGNLLSPN